MKVWTVQKRAALETIQREGIYNPDFSLSTYAKQIPDLFELYYQLLYAFNSINGTDHPGLVFGFIGCDNNRCYDIDGIDSFIQFLRPRLPAVDSLWRTISKEDAVLLELEYSCDFNPLLIDINDYQAIMPPVDPMKYYPIQRLRAIHSNLMKGVLSSSSCPSGIVQIHVPNISLKNIVNVWEVPSPDQLLRHPGPNGFAVILSKEGWDEYFSYCQKDNNHHDIQRELEESLRGQRIIFIYKSDGEIRGELSVVQNTAQSCIIDRLSILQNYDTFEAYAELLHDAVESLKFMGFSELISVTPLNNVNHLQFFVNQGFRTILDVNSISTGTYISLLRQF